MGLLKNTSKSAHSDVTLLRHNYRISVPYTSPDEFHVATSLSRLLEANRFQSSLDLAKGERPKLPQPQPQSSATSAVA